MPIFEYDCPARHRTERIRKYVARDEPVTCHCGQPARRIVSLPHCVPDGMYSYAPNVGSEAQFARRLDAMKNGEKLIPKELPAES